MVEEEFEKVDEELGKTGRRFSDSPRRKKICAGEFDFCRGEFAMTTVHPFSFFHREKLNKSENSCHSLHGCCNRLNINTLPCNVLVFRMSLMSLG